MIDKREGTSNKPLRPQESHLPQQDRRPLPKGPGTGNGGSTRS